MPFVQNVKKVKNGPTLKRARYAKMRLGYAEKGLLYNFITFFQECFSGLADFQYISGLAISGLKNLEN
jgi:hypothetical protein